MGRIKTMLIKRTGNKIIKLHRDKVTKDFEKNKKAVEKLAGISSKKLRNVVAGYVTRLAKQED